MAYDAYLKIDGIDGEEQAKGFEKHIGIHSFSWGMQNTINVAGTGHAAGKVHLQHITVVKSLDKSSPVLMKMCAKGEHKGTASINFLKSGAGDKPVPYLTITLTTAYLESYSVGYSTGSDAPTETLVLAFEEVKYEYSQQDNKGNVTKGATFHHHLKTHVTT